MSNGGRIGAAVFPTPIAAGSSGIWTPDDVPGFMNIGLWPAMNDPYFANVTLLCHCDVTPANKGSGTTITYNVAGAISAAQNRFNGTSYSEPTASTGAVVASAANAGYSFSTGDFTIEMWIYPVSGVGNIIDFRTAGTSLAPLVGLQAAGALQYFVNGAAVIGPAGNACTAGSWHHVAVSRVSGSTMLFCDGVQIGATWTDATTYTSNGCSFGNGNTQVGIGVSNPACYIAECRVTKGVGRYTGSYVVPNYRFADY